jgi:uncharacterized protein YegL
MKGQAIDAVNSGIQLLLKNLRSDPFALETVYLGILSFNTEAHIIRSFGDILNNESIIIEAKGQSNLGLGLELLMQEMNRNIIKTTKNQKGDWKPLVFFMTDGRPSGPWKKKLKEFHSLNSGKWIVCACGIKSNLNLIDSMGGNVIVLNNKNDTSIHSFFKWVSNSISSHSKSIEQSQTESNSQENFKIHLDK